MPLEDTNYPRVCRLPDHRPEGNANPNYEIANACAGVVVTVTMDFDKCSKCGGNMAKHPSGMCRICYGKAYDAGEVT